MAPAPSESVEDDADSERERIAALEAELERERRHRQAAEQWATYLEDELRTCEERLDGVIEQYERQLRAAQERDDERTPGLWERLTRWRRRR